MQNQDENDKLDDISNILSMEGYDKPVRRARIVLFIIAGVQLLSIILLRDLPEPIKTISICLSVFVALIFVLIGLWTRTKPYTAIITGIVVYSILIIAIGIRDFSIFMQGWYIKIGIYIALISALSNARDVQRWKDSIKDKL